MEEKEVYKQRCSEISKVNHRLVKLSIVQAVSYCIAIVLMVGLMVGFYFYSNYGYDVGCSTQTQGQAIVQTAGEFKK